MENERKTWQIVASVVENYLQLDCTGDIKTTEELLAFAADLYVLIEQNGMQKVLNVMDAMNIPLSIASYYSLVESYMNDYPPSNHLLKIAIVMNEKYKEQGSFWEAVCNNRGFEYLSFTNKETALSWLKSK
ncbi:MAG: hypothetical protein RLZZ543_960 [Bacteroidota bacterium]